MISTEDFNTAVSFILTHNLEKLNLLISQKPNLVNWTQDGDTLLHIATDNNCVQAIQPLIDLHSDPNAQNEFGETCLHLAVFRGFVEIVEIFLRNNANCSVLNKDGKSPLNYAEEFGEGRIKQMILDFAAESVDFCYSHSSISEVVFDSDWVDCGLISKYHNKNSAWFLENQDSTVNSVNITPQRFSQAYIETRRTIIGEDVFDFLYSIKLAKYFKSFIENGFDHLASLILQMKTPFPLTHDILKKTGMRTSNDRNKLLIVLNNLANQSSIVTEFNDISDLISYLKLENYLDKFEALSIDLNNFYEMKDFEEKILIKKIGMNKIGHRLRIIGIVKLFEMRKKKSCNFL